jgi:nucleoside-diphosphate-sugar epimerase
MKLLVTGGAGFIGSAVVRAAIAQGHSVVNVDKLTYAACLDNVASCCNQVEMSALPQSRNVPLGGVRAWLGWVETSHIAALTSHAGVVIQRRVAWQPRPSP